MPNLLKGTLETAQIRLYIKKERTPKKRNQVGFKTYSCISGNRVVLNVGVEILDGHLIEI